MLGCSRYLGDFFRELQVAIHSPNSRVHRVRSVLCFLCSVTCANGFTLDLEGTRRRLSDCEVCTALDDDETEPDFKVLDSHRLRSSKKRREFLGCDEV